MQFKQYVVKEIILLSIFLNWILLGTVEDINGGGGWGWGVGVGWGAMLFSSGGPWGGTRGGGHKPPPPIVFTEVLVLKSGSTTKFLFQEVELLIII